MHTCLGDLYSVKWMENADTANLKTETLQQQYELVKETENHMFNNMVRSPKHITYSLPTVLTSEMSHRRFMFPLETTNFTDEPCANFEGDEDLNPPSKSSKVKAETMELSFVGGDSEVKKAAAVSHGMVDSGTLMWSDCSINISELRPARCNELMKKFREKV